MPSSTFERSITTSATPAEAWQVLTDVHRVAGWIPVVEGVTELAHLERYRAVLRDQVGPFKLRADLNIEVTEARDGEAISFRAAGEDRQVGSRLAVEAQLVLAESEPGRTSVAVNGRYEVVGRVATLGAGTIRKKASTILDQFFTNAEKALTG